MYNNEILCDMINKCKLKHKSGNKLCWIFCWMFFKKNMKFCVYIKFYTRQFSAVRSYTWSSNQQLNSICYSLNPKLVTVCSIFCAFLHHFLLLWFSMPFLHEFVPVVNSVLFSIVAGSICIFWEHCWKNGHWISVIYALFQTYF